jgi:chloramphenicol O-acetyltransferase type A
MGNKIKVDLETFAGASMYNRFIKEPSPGVCVTGRFNITRLYRKKKSHSLNAMLCYCVLQAAQNVKEFHYSIKKDGLYYYENVKTNAVVNGVDGQLYFADYKYFDNFKDFEREYVRVNEYCSTNCVNFQEDTGALVSTSTIIGYPFESISLDVATDFWDNFLMWGKYQKRWGKIVLNISLRFHHATIDGQRAAMFFNELQNQINHFRIK